MCTQSQKPVISVILPVNDTPAAVEWYKRALGATLLWSLGPVAGMEILGAPFFLNKQERNGIRRSTALWPVPAACQPPAENRREDQVSAGCNCAADLEVAQNPEHENDREDGRLSK